LAEIKPWKDNGTKDQKGGKGGITKRPKGGQSYQSEGSKATNKKKQVGGKLRGGKSPEKNIIFTKVLPPTPRD